MFALGYYISDTRTHACTHTQTSDAEFTSCSCDGDFYRNQLLISIFFLVCGILCLNMFIVPCALCACISAVKVNRHSVRYARACMTTRLWLYTHCATQVIPAESSLSSQACNGAVQGVVASPSLVPMSIRERRRKGWYTLYIHVIFSTFLEIRIP